MGEGTSVTGYGLLRAMYPNYRPLVLRNHVNMMSTNLYSEGLIDLVFHGETMTVPSEPSLHMEPTLVGVASHHVLQKMEHYTTVMLCISMGMSRCNVVLLVPNFVMKSPGEEQIVCIVQILVR